MPMYSLRRTAFTLVEMAIVMVIVGLLAGGVLVGRDMIKAAEVRGFLNTINKFNVAASAFRMKYRNLPGDLRGSDAVQYGFAARSGAVGHGDGNGIIESCVAGGGALGCETALFWRDLTDAELTSTHLVAATDISVDGTAGGFKLTDYLPLTAFRDGVHYFVYPREGRNNYYVSRITAVDATGNMTTTPGLTPSEARSIDEKLDDAVPNVGIVQAMSDLLTMDPGGTPADPTLCVISMAPPAPYTYNSSPAYSENVTCMISIRNSL